ncbi:hypothetical protein EDM56_12070 [Brevibacillus fluminis]|uniref:Uncharacterized protein n=1 Tax=Brevibacillus fluminis TaxID=511487 RepID=A0A3M8DP58_9BACL|nr:hypothetical protein [Brevibacillus fluminis]RNB89888.1 hypothetical protein EDM56_12070 [Brevibacillus fluminis]
MGNMNSLAAKRPAAKPFVLWREVAMAYVSPAVMAGIGGLITANRDLQIGALTTIGGASALVALLIGLWLQNNGRRIPWLVSTNRFAVVGAFMLIGIVVGLSAAWVASLLLWMSLAADQLHWFDRIWLDFPMSAAIASTLIAWRWRLTNK